MNEKAKQLAQEIEQLKQQFLRLPKLIERHNDLELDEYQHLVIELEERLIVFRYVLDEGLDSLEEQTSEQVEAEHEDEAVAEPEEAAEDEQHHEAPLDEALMEKAVQLEEEKQMVNDEISDEEDSLAEMLSKSPISDLRNAIGLNERFLFANELFNGNGEEFVRAINEFNHLENFTDAKRLIEAKYEKEYKWDYDDENVRSFISILERRYL